MSRRRALPQIISLFQVFSKISTIYQPCPNLDECMKCLEHNEKLAVAIPRIHALNHPFVDKSELFCFPSAQRISTYVVVMLSRKNSPKLPGINRIIEDALEFGLIKKWTEESQMTQRIRQRMGLTNVRVHQSGDGPVIFTLMHFESTLLIIVTGISIATFFFILELLAHYQLAAAKRKRQKPHAIWRLADMLINEKRYFALRKPSLFRHPHHVPEGVDNPSCYNY